ncbi:SDR family NAD(P)-dependent oxidoreductase [Salipiger sp.]|uniref:SDR family NAD(P)-dependent oxidoreductase n=1 Tax=Salipiger sp. TaxID=2078585 RepID=UPI003A98202C
MRLKDKVAVVTGANSGIGRAIADRFAEEGAIIAVVAMNQERIDSTVAEIKAAGGRAAGYRVDVSSQDEVKALMASVAEEFGRIDILINNAGITRYRPFDTTTGEDWDMVLNIDLKGVFFCAQAAAPYMRKQNYGRIVNISSAAGTGSTPGASAGSPGATAPYAAAKAAVNMLTKTLARELGPNGITVNAVAPGTFPTAISTSTRTPEELAAHLERRKQTLVLQRIGTLDEVATPVLFFASDDSSYVTGQTLCVDGGRFDRM